jgi:hypothetical protein
MRWIARRPWILLTGVVVGWWGVAGCGEETETEEPPPACACTADSCPEGVCDIAFTLPDSCGEVLTGVDVEIDGAAAGAAQVGSRYSSCAITIGEGESAQVELQSAQGDFHAGPGAALCELGGRSARSPFCTLRFELGRSCDGVIEEASVVIEGEVVGTTRPDEPYVPCRLLVEGESIQTAIRAGTAFVLAAPMDCPTPGHERRLTMECQ